jgi:peptide/nickel transport system permease protein
MRNFVLKRVLTLIPTLVGISLIVFLVMRLIPGDTISAMIGTQFKLTEAQAEAMRRYYGLDKSLPEQYAVWFTAALQGDFGYSVRSGQPVLTEIARRYPLTMELALVAMLIALAVGIPIGLVSAYQRDTILDYAGRLFALAGLAIPGFWMGTLLIYFLSVYLHILPNSGAYVEFGEDPLENLKQIIFPALTLGLAFSAAVMRTTRSALLEELNKDYARTARAKGRSERGVILRHCFKNALIPVITLVGLEAGYLLGGAIIIEEVFALPGLGRLLLNGINQRDYALVQGVILFIAFSFVMVNLLADLAYGMINPRVRYE